MRQSLEDNGPWLGRARPLRGRKNYFVRVNTKWVWDF